MRKGLAIGVWFLGGLIGGAVLSATSQGGAYWAEGYGHQNCERSDEDVNPGVALGGTLARSVNSTFNSNTSTSLTLSCPIDNSDSIALKSADNGYVDVYDGRNTTSVTAVACANRWDALGGSCGTVFSTGNAYVGPYNMAINMNGFTDALNDEGDYFFYRVTLPAWTGGTNYGTRSHVFGYTITDL